MLNLIEKLLLSHSSLHHKKEQGRVIFSAHSPLKVVALHKLEPFLKVPSKLSLQHPITGYKTIIYTMI